MYRMMRIVEVAWVIVAAICIYELFRLWNDPGNTKWYFAVFLLVAVFMFFFRRKQRQRYERRAREKQEQDQ